MDFSHQMHFGTFSGFLFREHSELYRFAPVCLKKLGSYALAVMMEKLACCWLDGMYGPDRPDGMGWDRVGMEGTVLVGAGSGAPPLALEVQQVAVSEKRRLSPISIVLQGAWSICVSVPK